MNDPSLRFAGGVQYNVSVRVIFNCFLFFFKYKFCCLVKVLICRNLEIFFYLS
jgi:hypothetical protein